MFLFSSSCNDEHNRASRYCRPPVITLASKAMVNNAQQRATSPIFGTSNNANRFNTNNTPIQNNYTPSEMGRRIERVVSAPLLLQQPKSCLRRKSCLHKSTPSSIEVTDKSTDMDNCSERKW